ncbi:putative ankyrin repeat protein RF_0381 [Microplitis demolitor]|uniref:putative ankyrin repeat protein RF_0381 n=1 Tax=Microplitis demolitor TaxID=69319 RepID=UPI0004CDAB97|nr:putative ankyrin repeat protein RF_0381 [Microplitis demolitor]
MSSVSSSNSENNFSKGGLLYQAVREGNIESVKEAIRQGIDVNKLGPSGFSSLHVAAWNGYLEIIKLLIKNGAHLESVSNGPIKYGYTPLHLACLNNKIECVKVLLKYGASVTPKAAGVHHPIHIAVFKNYVEVAALLLNHGADVNLRFDNTFFYNKWDKLIFWKDMDLTLLHCSIARKYKEMTALLLKHGADINLKTRSNKTSLMHAVEANDPELVESFLEKGANPNDQDIYGEPVGFFTVLNANSYQSTYNYEELERKYEKLEIMKLLYNAGTNINANFEPVASYSSLIYYAIVLGHTEIVKFILFETDFNYQSLDSRAIYLARINPRILSRNPQVDSNFIKYLTKQFLVMKYSLVIYVISKHMIGWPVEEQLLATTESPIAPYQSIAHLNQDYIKNKIKNIINTMKKTFIGNTIISYWRILTCKKSELVKISRNQELQSLRVSDYKNEFYLYHYTIKVRLEAAIEQSILFVKTIEILSSLFGDHLKYDCCEQIAMFFNDQELKELVNFSSDDKF